MMRYRDESRIAVLVETVDESQDDLVGIYDQQRPAGRQASSAATSDTSTTVARIIAAIWCACSSG